jgi:hypothetical protein
VEEELMATQMGTRLYASAYNQLEQAERSKESGAQLTSYLGRLRLDSIAFKTIVIPLDFILDGSYFLQANPGELLNSLARAKGSVDLPLEILGSRTSFDASLRAMMLRDSHLHGLVIDSISDARIRKTIALSLRGMETAVLDEHIRRSGSVALGITKLLREILHREGLEDDGELDRLERGWRNWSSVLDSRIRLKSWHRPTRYAEALGYGYMTTENLVDEDWELLADLHRLASVNPVYHSDVRLLFSRARTSTASTTRLHEIDRIESFAERGWDRAVALEYECSYAYEPAVDEPAWDRLSGMISNLEESDEFLPPGIITRLGLLPTEKFQAIIGLSYDDLNDWWNLRSEAALRRFMGRLERELEALASTGDDFDQKVVDLLISIPSIAVGSAAAWGLDHLAGLGSGLGEPVGTAVGALGTLAGVYATRRFRTRPQRNAVQRLVEYCLVSRGAS